MSELQVIRVSTLHEMHEALSVRRRVFIEEQGVPEALEVDQHDGDPVQVTTALHVLARAGGSAVATGRLLLPDEDGRAHIGRVAVLAEERGRGYGTAVMLALHDLAREQGLEEIVLAAQLHAIGFYERLGYEAHGDILDAGIKHRWMDRRL